MSWSNFLVANSRITGPIGVFLVLAVTYFGLEATISEVVQSDLENERVQLAPNLYEIRLKLSADEEVGSGTVKIFGKVQEVEQEERDINATLTTRNIYLITNNLNINTKSIVISDEHGAHLPIAGFSDDEGGGRFVIQLKREVELNSSLTLEMEYDAPITSPHTYRGTIFRDVLDNSSFLFSEHFSWGAEGTFFPTLENSEFARHQLTLIRKRDYYCVSNMNLTGSYPEDGDWFRDEFEDTGIISYQKVFLFLSNLTYMQERTEDGTRLRIHSSNQTLTKLDQGRRILITVERISDFLRQYFNRSHPLGRIDVIWTQQDVLQGQVFSGVVADRVDEFWDEKLCARTQNNYPVLWEKYIVPITKQWFDKAKAISHEVLYYIKGLSYCRPGSEWRMRENLNILCNQQYPLVYGIGDRDVTYYFGLCHLLWIYDFKLGANVKAGLLRMFADENILGEDGMRKGIFKYMENLPNEKNDEDTLSSALQSTLEAEVGSEVIPEGASIKTISDSFSDASTHFMVKVDAVNDTHLAITPNVIKRGEMAQNHSVYLPISIQTGNGNKTFLWLENGSSKTIQFDVKNSGWILLNPNMTSIHRTIYDEVLLQRLLAQLESNPKVFSPLARIRLLDDNFHYFFTFCDFTTKNNLTGTPYENVSLPDSLRLTRYLDKEDDLLVWNYVLGIIQHHTYQTRFDLQYDHRFFGYNQNYVYKPYFPPLLEAFKEYFRPKFDSVLKSIDEETLANEPCDILALKANILYWACKLGNTLCIQKGHNLLRKWKNEPTLFMLAPRFSTVWDKSRLIDLFVLIGGEEAFNLTLQQFSVNCSARMDDNWQISLQLIQALSHAQEEPLITRLLEMGLEENPLICDQPSYFSIRIYLEVDLNPIGREVARDFLYKNFDRVVDARRTGKNYGDGVDKVVQQFPRDTHPSQLQQLEKFLNDKEDFMKEVDLELFNREMEGRKNSLRGFQDWMQSTGYDVIKWLQANK